MLRCQPRAFGFAGTKDKRGVTTQHVTVFRQRVESLLSLSPRLYGIKIGNFMEVDAPLGLGQLKGNEFLITLREVSERAH